MRPIKTLTAATKKIAEGHIRLNIHQQDENGVLAQHFRQMAKSLSQLEDMRQEFVSNVSHEIQSPLTSIQGFSQALRDETLTKDQRTHYLSIIGKESRRLSLLSKQLLTLAFLDRTDDVLDKTTFDVAEQIKQVIVATEWQWREKNMTIDMNLPSTYIATDQKLLHQAWTNLITNSIKFSEKEGDLWMHISQTNNDEALIEILDNGIGISKEDLPYIFDRFYKADKVRRRETASSGLGLAITKKSSSFKKERLKLKVS